MTKKTLLIIGFIFLFFFINYFPHLYGWIKTSPDKFFSGHVSWFDPWDINNYLAAIRWGQNTKHFLYENLFTTEITKPFPIYFIYTLTGIVLPSVNLALLYHGLSMITGPFLLWIIFRNILYFISNRTTAFFTLFLVCFGGGFGGLDISMTGLTFTGIWQKPHEIIALGLFLESLIGFTRLNNKTSVYKRWLLRVTLVISLILYPFKIINYAIITGSWILLSWRTSDRVTLIKEWLVSLVFSAIILFSYTNKFSQSGFFSLLLNRYEAVNFIDVLIGYGFIIPLLIIGFIINPRINKLQQWLIVWITTTLILTAFPFGWSRLYLSGLFFPLSLLTLIKLEILMKQQRLIMVIFVFILIPLSTYFIFYQRINAVNQTDNSWMYMSKKKQLGLKFIETQKADGVLANYILSNQVSKLTGKHVYLGHLIQTPKAEEKYEKLMRFYQKEMNDNEACMFLRENKINIIVFEDSEIQKKYSQSCLSKQYENSEIVVFQVR